MKGLDEGPFDKRLNLAVSLLKWLEAPQKWQASPPNSVVTVLSAEGSHMSTMPSHIHSHYP